MSAKHDAGSKEWESRRALLAERIRRVRVELFGENGEPDLAKALGIPARTLANYENGVIVPGHILLHLLEVTDVEPWWLFRGEGPMFRASPADGGRRPSAGVAEPTEDRETG